MRVKNDIKEIERVLHLEEGSTQHEGNFIFSGKLNGHYVMIMTESTDEEQSEINIYSLEIAEEPAEPRRIEVTATYQAPNSEGSWVEGCFTISVKATVSKEERDDIINKIAPDMAKLQGLSGMNVTVINITEEEQLT